MRRLLFFILTSSALLWMANAAATKYDLYFITSWYDIIPHILGGSVVAGAMIYFVICRQANGWNLPKLSKVLIFTLFVGISWEFFERNYGLTRASDPLYFLDTLSDLFFDLLGACMAYLFVSKKHQWQKQVQ